MVKKSAGRPFSRHPVGLQPTGWRSNICRSHLRPGFLYMLESGGPGAASTVPAALGARFRGHDGKRVFIPLPLQMRLQPRHQLDEVAGAEAVVELVHQDPLPGVAAGAGRARQGEEIGPAGNPGRRPALDRRGPDLVIAEPAEKLAKAGDLLLIDAVEGLGRDVASGD